MSCTQDVVETTRLSSVGGRETRDLKAWSTGEVHKELGWSWSPGLGRTGTISRKARYTRQRGSASEREEAVGHVSF